MKQDVNYSVLCYDNVVFMAAVLIVSQLCVQLKESLGSLMLNKGYLHIVMRNTLLRAPDYKEGHTFPNCPHRLMAERPEKVMSFYKKQFKWIICLSQWKIKSITSSFALIR